LGISDNFDAEDRVGAVSDLHKTSIAVVGTFCHRKNQELVFKALKLMSASSLAKLELIFVGQKKGRYYKSLIRVLKNEKLPVFFTGEILDITEKWRLFADIDIFCVPSRDESCSLVVLEAFMLAKPVVISDKVGARYLVEPGKNGFIFQNDNAESLKNILEYLIEEPRLLAELGQSARDTYLEKATLEQFATRFIQVVDSVLLV
jgi:Glycosyltransferase